MAQNRYQLEGRSLPEIGAQALRSYGPTARIVNSERITTKGFAGLLSRPYYRATVEVYTSTPASTFEAILQPPSTEHHDDELEGEIVEITPQHDQQSGDEESFLVVMDELRRSLRDPGPEALATARNSVPPLVSDPGALVVVVGLGADAGLGAQRLGLSAQMLSLDLSEFATLPLEETKRSLRALQAEAVIQGVPVLIAAPLAFPAPEVRSGVDHPVIIDAAQLWVAVDVSRKPEDTKRWLSLLAGSRIVDAVVPLRAEQTSTPESCYALGLPSLPPDQKQAV